jgi:hypothetical protein
MEPDRGQADRAGVVLLPLDLGREALEALPEAVRVQGSAVDLREQQAGGLDLDAPPGELGALGAAELQVLAERRDGGGSSRSRRVCARKEPCISSCILKA